MNSLHPGRIAAALVVVLVLWLAWWLFGEAPGARRHTLYADLEAFQCPPHQEGQCHHRDDRKDGSKVDVDRADGGRQQLEAR